MLHGSSLSVAPTWQPGTSFCRLHSIRCQNGVTLISHDSSLRVVPGCQPRTRMGQLHSMERQNMVTLILHGPSSSIGPTCQHGTRTGQLHSMRRPPMVTLILYGSSSRTTPMQQPRTRVDRPRLIWRHNGAKPMSHGSSQSMQQPRLHHRSSSLEQHESTLVEGHCFILRLLTRCASE